MPAQTIDNMFITLMAQMNKILRHDKDNNFFLPHICCCKHEKDLIKSLCTIKASKLTFIPTSSALSTFCFDNNGVCSNNKTGDETKTIAVAERKPNKTEQTSFEAALLAPVAFHQEPNNKGNYSL